MKTNKELLKPGWRSAAVAVALSACLVNFTACSKYDLDETDPEGWGASIYSYLSEDGNYTNTIRLINDLELKDVLGKTGSKTMFVADDDAYARFYANNGWGVHDYGQLSLSQKKMLLMGSIVNSSYQVDDLSSLEGPVEGQCMRRISSQTIFDTVAVVKTTALPDMKAGDERWNKTWKKFANRDKIVLMKDMTQKPMLHFIEAQMANNKITNDDYNFLYNYTTDRSAGDASVNGVKIEKQNIKCSNGFIHKMENVITPLDNMAEIIASKPQASIFNNLLERFCAPYYVGKSIVEQYNDKFGTNVDSIFQKRFFSSKSQGGKTLTTDDDNNSHADMLLRYDPGWNSYYEGNAIPSAEVALEKNMGFMMVPSNEAMQNYWENGAGIVLKNQYGSWDNVPNDVVMELINNNMQSDFVGKGVPSKFSSLLNDANDPMGVSKEAIDSVWLGCNGAVYLTNKVFSPTTFVSVLYPAVVNNTMKVIQWAVQQNQYNVYLNSLSAYYSFFIPTNKAMLEYVDPASFGKTDTQLYRFYYDDKLKTVWASVHTYDMATRTVTDSIGEVHDVGMLKPRLKDILDNHIVVGNVESGYTYYKTMGGQEIKVNNVSHGSNGMTVEGSMQLNETLDPLRVSYVYDQTKQGNGKCYVLDGEPIQTTRKSVIDMMSEHEEMDEMRMLLEGSSLMEQIRDETHACVSRNISVFNTFNYTVYVPTNAAIQALQQKGTLPTWDQVESEKEQGQLEAASSDSLKIEKFLRYHIQDGSLFIGAEPKEEKLYETALIGSNGKFERLYATLSNSELYVRTSTTDNSPRKVIKTDGLYNLMAREYLLDSSDAKTANSVYTSSTAVIHLIDGALIKK